jgi:hypothetical protein
LEANDMYNPLEYDLVSLERRQRAEAARKYIVRANPEQRRRAGRERTPVSARSRALLASMRSLWGTHPAADCTSDGGARAH